MNKKNNEKTFEEGFKEFVNYCKAKSLANDTITNGLLSKSLILIKIITTIYDKVKGF
ncbi:hypothetical protein [Clostridium estertheticum]|uniref:Uncharacterized protein n=1 Tax=Clostridium estertheticum TaxID=238834 RepID=A0AA47EEP5_9CLOT|nr:hypothetical protein [Clostridium estertheticum]MBU3155011.1 hypothetical protein [Clostridium estertheticum]WAG58829.1 hypothetical protein LL038_14325 [Clostridium estertheticum]